MARYTAPLPRLNAALTPPRALMTPSRPPQRTPLHFPSQFSLSLALFRLGYLTGVGGHRHGIWLAGDHTVSPRHHFVVNPHPLIRAHLMVPFISSLPQPSDATVDHRISPATESSRPHLDADSSHARPRRPHPRIRHAVPSTVIASPSPEIAGPPHRRFSRANADHRVSHCRSSR